MAENCKKMDDGILFRSQSKDIHLTVRAGKKTENIEAKMLNIFS